MSWLHPLCTLPRGILYVNKIQIPELSHSQLSQPLLSGEMLQSLHLHGPCETFSSMSLSLLHWVAKNWREDLSYGLTSAEENWSIASLDLLAVFYLMQHRIPSAPSAVFAARTHCWLMFSLDPSGSFLPSCSPTEWPQAHSGASACSSPRARPCTSPCSASPSSCWSISLGY